jgi:hypothetical protein
LKTQEIQPASGTADPHAATTVMVTWCRFQPRTQALAVALGARPFHIFGALHGRGRAVLPLRYLVDAVSTWRLLSHQSPATVVAASPPVFLSLLAWLWCTLHRRQLVVDCHTGTFHSARWRWALPLQRAILRRARAVLVHSEADERLVLSWHAPVILLPDDLPQPSDAVAEARGRLPRILIAGRLDADEPVAAVMAAAARLPEVELRFTGEAGHLAAALRAGMPKNVILTGFLAYPAFLREMASADVVGVFTTDPFVMSRAAFEAIGLCRPLVLSDSDGLRHRFARAALFSSHDPDDLAGTLRQALYEQQSLSEKSRRLSDVLRRQRDDALAHLRSLLEPRPINPRPLTAAS